MPAPFAGHRAKRHGTNRGACKGRGEKRRGIRRLVRLFRKNQTPEPLILSYLTQGFSLNHEEAKSFL